jgi:acetyltransferase-like isoleucine patch superfamily enzyme
MIRKVKNLILYIFLKFFGAKKYAEIIGVSIGKGCRIYNDDWGSEPYLISIGDMVTVSKRVVFITHDGSPWIFKNEHGRYYKYGKITIGNNVFIGMNSIIMPGINVGDNVIIGSGSVVTKSLPGGKVYAGNPAREVCTIEKYYSKVKKQFCHSHDFIQFKNEKDRILAMEKSFMEKIVND